MNTHLWVFFIEEVKALDGQIYVIYIGFIHDVTCKIEMLSTITNKFIVVISVSKKKNGRIHDLFGTIKLVVVSFVNLIWSILFCSQFQR